MPQRMTLAESHFATGNFWRMMPSRLIQHTSIQDLDRERGWGGYTVWDFSDEIGDENRSGSICEVVPFQLEIFAEPHDCGILFFRQITLPPQSLIERRTLSKTLSINCIV